MFVRFADKKGRDIWVNPLHVKAVAPAGERMADLYFTYGAWGSGATLRVQSTGEEASLALSAAMPPIAFVPDNSEEVQRQQQAAATTVIT